MPDNVLIGHSGYVGGTLGKQAAFPHAFRSTDIHQLGAASYHTAYCCAAPGQKWLANKDPEGDLQSIQRLIAHLELMRCERFVLISTVDVFKDSLGADENSPVDEQGLHAYGLHRRLLEKFAESHFKRSLIVRLPGLVGPGLRKNVVFDFHNNNNLHAIDSRGVFQFYPMVNLWFDIQTALETELQLLHLTAQPVSVAEVASLGFNQHFEQAVGPAAARYDMRSIHADRFGGRDGYQYSKRESIQAIRAYAQSEPRTLPAQGGKA